MTELTTTLVEPSRLRPGDQIVEVDEEGTQSAGPRVVSVEVIPEIANEDNTVVITLDTGEKWERTTPVLKVVQDG